MYFWFLRVLILNYLQKKSYFFHSEKDIINIRYIVVYLLSYVLHVCMIWYTKYWNHISDLFLDSSKSMEIIAFIWKQ